jgi:hypothetical protein
VVQLRKQLVFPQVVRPSAFLEGMPELSLVTGVELHRHMSFPSGHMTAAFALCIGRAVVIEKTLACRIIGGGGSDTCLFPGVSITAFHRGHFWREH